MVATNRYLRPSFLGAIGLVVGDITFFRAVVIGRRQSSEYSIHVRAYNRPAVVCGRRRREVRRSGSW